MDDDGKRTRRVFGDFGRVSNSPRKRSSAALRMRLYVVMRSYLVIAVTAADTKNVESRPSRRRGSKRRIDSGIFLPAPYISHYKVAAVPTRDGSRVETYGISIESTAVYSIAAYDVRGRE